MKNHLIGLILGLVIGVIDCGLFAASGMPLTPPVIISALVFWTAVGWVIHSVTIPLPSILKGLVVSLFLNTPWIIEFVFVQELSDMLIPMLSVATIFGVLLGLTSGIINKKSDRGVEAPI
ncbi:hypothetical protein [Kiloniella sp.]|uniref:hypothetical protein n=1 Tax=Kiloniella sp. TaxID=1938587 RepID=UPI003B027FEF